MTAEIEMCELCIFFLEFIIPFLGISLFIGIIAYLIINIWVPSYIKRLDRNREPKINSCCKQELGHIERIPYGTYFTCPCCGSKIDFYDANDYTIPRM